MFAFFMSAGFVCSPSVYRMGQLKHAADFVLRCIGDSIGCFLPTAEDPFKHLFLEPEAALIVMLHCRVDLGVSR